MLIVNKLFPIYSVRLLFSLILLIFYVWEKLLKHVDLFELFYQIYEYMMFIKIQKNKYKLRSLYYFEHINVQTDKTLLQRNHFKTVLDGIINIKMQVSKICILNT